MTWAHFTLRFKQIKMKKLDVTHLTSFKTPTGPLRSLAALCPSAVLLCVGDSPAQSFNAVTVSGEICAYQRHLERDGSQSESSWKFGHELFMLLRPLSWNPGDDPPERTTSWASSSTTTFLHFRPRPRVCGYFLQTQLLLRGLVFHPHANRFAGH